MSLFATRCRSLTETKKNKEDTDRSSAHRAKNGQLPATNCLPCRVRSKTNENIQQRLFYGRSSRPVLRLTMPIRVLVVCNLNPTVGKTRAWNKHHSGHNINVTIRKKLRGSHLKISSSTAKKKKKTYWTRAPV